ncbi:hypothetical protein DdX_21454 [Ditylenchus destructor]|uniref:STPR domain-containing protein n=1 Tax=Ditylenchus destructor TaxID=166010 RepID=A0AAD4MFI6_9BILA|nr:hypothetical protein DdX_21454 [Ditylenchus destructor]
MQAAALPRLSSSTRKRHSGYAAIQANSGFPEAITSSSHRSSGQDRYQSSSLSERKRLLAESYHLTELSHARNYSVDQKRELYQENETIAELERFDGQETFTIHNAIELLNTNYDYWKSHFTGTSSDDDSIKAFISYENLHYPDNLADLANKCGVDVVTLTNAFENGLDITHEIITHVSNSSDENSVHTDQTSLKKKPGRPSKKRGKPSLDRQTKEKNQAKNRNQNYRDNETPEQRNKRLSQMNDRNISRRSNETQEDRNKRLSQQKNIDISRRSNETQEDRNKRLSQMNDRNISRRSNETQDERNKRLSQQLERQNELINNRTQAENIRKESEILVGTLSNVNDITPFSLGSFDYKCKDCGALHFEMEASLNANSTHTAKLLCE